MNKSILIENEKKRIDYPISRLLCFAMFTIWQMGVIYYMGPSLVISGRTPLPISTDNITVIIASAYIVAIIYMSFLPSKFVWATRISICLAMLTTLSWFLPLSTEIATLSVYLHCFTCCFLITFETVIIVFLFSEKTTILHLLVCYGIGYIVIAFLQNDVYTLPFSIFRFTIVIMVGLLMYFYFRLPSNVCPTFVRKKDSSNKLPKRLFFGIYFMIFLAALMAVIGPAAVTETTHGVSITYMFSAISAFTIYFIYRIFDIHPLKSISVVITLGVLGFLSLFLSLYVPILSVIACALIGVGFIPCALIPLYGVVLMKEFPSRFIPSTIMCLAVIAVLIQSSIVETFRNNLHLLYLSYLVLIVFLAISYLMASPYLLHSLDERFSLVKENAKKLPKRFDMLTEREIEVADLISRGFTNKDIAKILFISEHTVNDHSKNIYKKLDIHSRHELATMINRK